MPCPSCGTDNEAGRKFCHECGSRLSLGCPSCGAPNSPGAKYCGECGFAIALTDATPPRATATPSGAERRVVTVLFADLVGFTTISESRDAEDVRELLGRYFETSREIVERYGGTVEKFIGDAVMAVWGAPVAREDDAERAVRAALDLVDAAQRIGQETGVSDLALRAGVLTGEAAVTLGTTNQGMVAGDLVNTASRLQSVAPAGSVLVGESTHRAAAGAIAFEPAGEQLLKGKATPVPAFRALRVVAKRGGAGRSDQLEPPFVGRETELRLVKDFYHATARERGVRLVSVLGQGGIGKSRLAWEFLKYIDGLTEDVYWHQGRSPAYGDGISFWALGEMVRMRAGIGEGESEAATRSKLTASLEQFVTDAEERRNLEGPLLQLLGIEESRGQGREALFAAWRTFFERIADVSTVVLVFEDLQWADDGLLDFIEEMLAWSRGRPIYLITLSRPELLDRRATWGAGQRAFTSLSLAPLRDEDMVELLHGLVPGLPEATVEAILQRAEGIPLYAVETVRMLLNNGQVEPIDGGYRPVGDLTELAVPESLHSLIAARMDALPAEQRALLQDASVLGLSFRVEALAGVTGTSEETLRPMLRELARRELLTMEDDPRSPERGQFRFVQALLREVAYGTLARRDRRARHLAAARHFEALGDEELSGVLAQHYLDAFHAQPDGPEGAAVAGQALITLRGAAERASGLGSHDRALAYLEQALNVVPEPRVEMELRQAAGKAAAFAGRMEPAERHLRQAVDLARSRGDDAARRTATADLANVLLEGQHEQARALLEEALAEPALQPDSPGFVDLAEVRAKLEMRTGHNRESVEWSDRALPAAEGLGDDRLTHELLITRATALANIGRPAEAVATLTGAQAICERRGLIDAALRAAINLSYVLGPDDVRTGTQVARDGLALARRYGMRIGVRYLFGNATSGAMDIGDWDWVTKELSEELSGRDLEPAERLWYESLDAVIRAYRGEDVRARVDELWQLATQFDDHQYRGNALYAAYALSLVTNRPEDAFALVEQMPHEGVTYADSTPYSGRLAIWMGDADRVQSLVEAHEGARKGRRWTAQHAMLLGGLAQMEGRPAEARAHYAQAMRLYRDLGLHTDLAECQLDIVRSGAMEPEERRAAAIEAREFFERVGAKGLLERLDEFILQPSPEPAGRVSRSGV